MLNSDVNGLSVFCRLLSNPNNYQTQPMKLKYTIAALAATTLTSQGAIVNLVELHMGEAGSTGANNVALDTSGNGYHMQSTIGGTLTIDTATPAAPGSTSYTTFDGSHGLALILRRRK